MTPTIRSETPPTEANLWRTPPEIFTYASKRYGPFDLDAAADRSNHLCDLWLGPGGLVEDALSTPWGGDGDRKVWCNPPYERGMEAAFAYKASEEVMAGNIVSATLLLKASTDTKYFHDLIWDAEANSPYIGVIVDLLRGRVRFLRPDGTRAQTPQFPSMLVTFF